MGFGTILVLALGLAMDSMAVSAARGLAAPRIELRHVLSVALAFGAMQALMPAIGWAVGARFGPEMKAWDHWIAFVILGGLGIKMLLESREAPERPEGDPRELFAAKTLLLLGIATSIDALVAGISLPLLGAPLALSLATIGIVTAVMSAVGLFAGRSLGARFGNQMDALGGLALLGIGTKILAEHLTA